MNNWAYNLDMLAQNGVLDYDAPAFIMGQNPRYIGSPSAPPSPFVNGMPPAPKLQQPEIDEFQPEKDKKDIIKNPSWKKWAFGLLAAGALIFTGFKFKSTIIPGIKKGWKKFTKALKWSSIKTFGVDKAKAVGKFFKKCRNKLFKNGTP